MSASIWMILSGRSSILLSCFLLCGSLKYAKGFPDLPERKIMDWVEKVVVCEKREVGFYRKTEVEVSE